MKLRVLCITVITVATVIVATSLSIPSSLIESSNTTESLLAQYEVDVEQFEKITHGNFTTYYKEHQIGEALVEGDYEGYVFQSDTGELLKRDSHWRDDLPTELPQDLITKEEVLATVGNEEARAYLYYLSDDSEIFWIEPVPENPCWVVWETKEVEIPNSSPCSYRFGTVIDAVNREILASGTPPITNLDLPAHEPGTVVLGNGVVTTFTGMTSDGGYEFKATIGAPQYLDDLHTPIDPSWSYDNDTGLWNTNANLFSASIRGTEILLEHEGLNLSWKPDVFVGAEKQNASVGQLLSIDPVNEYYSNNTIRWSYGNISRCLRVIEGMLLEYYVIPSLPTDNVAIVPNVIEDEGFTARSGSKIAWDSNFTRLNLIVEGDNITLTLESMENATFPVTIDPPASFTSLSADGCLEVYPANSYQVAHDSEEATEICDWQQYFVIGQYYDGHYYIARSFPYFNSTPLPENIEITSATLRLRGAFDHSDQDFYVALQSGMPKYPYTGGLLARDYNMDWYEGNGGQIVTYDWDGSGWNEIPLSSEGLGWIKTADLTKFCLRSTRDIGIGIEPDGREAVAAWAYEKGEGYRPELEVTYVIRDIEAFSSGGPYNNDCNDGWYDIATTTAAVYESMGYPTLIADMPSSELVEAMVSNDYIALFHEHSHGGTRYFTSGCYMAGVDNTWYYHIEDWLEGYSAMPFTFLYSCNCLCDTGNDTLVNAFTKGGMNGSVVVGYCGLPNPECDDCYNQLWKDEFLGALANGSTVGEAYNLTCSSADPRISGCCKECFQCARVFGDTNIKLVPKVYREDDHPEPPPTVGYVTGEVRDVNGELLYGVEVCLYRKDGTCYDCVIANPDYNITVHDLGVYYLVANPGQGCE